MWRQEEVESQGWISDLYFLVSRSDIENSGRKRQFGEDVHSDKLYFRQIWEIQMKLFSLQLNICNPMVEIEMWIYSRVSSFWKQHHSSKTGGMKVVVGINIGKLMVRGRVGSWYRSLLVAQSFYGIGEKPSAKKGRQRLSTPWKRVIEACKIL